MNKIKKYAVSWSKTYYASGEKIIEAKGEEEAQEMVREIIGNLEGSMQYDPNEDYVEAFELVGNDFILIKKNK